MRTSGLNRDEVFRICFELFSERQGRVPAYPAVAERYQERHGFKGSTKVLQEYVREWRAALEEQVSAPVKPDLPDEFVAEGTALIQQLYQSALQHANAAFEQLRTESQAQVAQAKGQLETAEGALRELQLAHDELIVEKQTLEARVSSLTGEVHTLTRQAAADKARITSLEHEISRADERLRAAQASHEQAVAAEREHAESREAELRRIHAGELVREREVFEGERRHLQEQTDRIRQGHVQELGDLRGRVAQLEQRLEGQNQALAAEREESARLRGENAALGREITCVREQFQQANAQLQEQLADRARIEQALLDQKARGEALETENERLLALIEKRKRPRSSPSTTT